MGQLLLLPDTRHWHVITDGDPRAAALYRRHYSAHQYRDGRRDNEMNRARHLVLGPGEKLLLMTAAADALFGWRRSQFWDNGQVGVNCAVFRNEGPMLSSALILEAEELAWRRWPGERLFTFVDSGAVTSRNPGYCFRRAGWRRCGLTKRGLLILEKVFNDKQEAGNG